VRIETEPYRGEIAREDVAAVLDALPATECATRLVLYVNRGEDRVERSLERVERSNAAAARLDSTSS
jgi:hypothetical protein